MTTSPFLNKIMQRKHAEVEQLLEITRRSPDHPLNRLRQQGQRACGTRFKSALATGKLEVIAEIKRRSPSLGSIREIADPVALATNYCLGGAAAISVLTDFEGFGGSLDDLQRVSAAVSAPTLRKDFILHPIQLAEAAQSGAAAALLIVAAVKYNLRFLMEEATHLGLETLVEVHDLQELEIALRAEAPIIGINHRNLHTFEIDLTLSEKLRSHIPNGVITVAESGIHTPVQAKQMADLGYHAVLVGEALVRATSPLAFIQALHNEEKHVN